MNFLNPQSTAVFNRLLALNQIKISNSKTFMAVCFELIEENKAYKVYSIAHYYLQNGDMMADPEMTFIYFDENHIAPASFKQDSIGMYQESLEVRNGMLYSSPELQKDHTIFANDWLKNIKNQQLL